MNTGYNPYDALGVTPDNDCREIKEAYIKLAFKYHPDRNPMNPEANEKMEELNKAYSQVSTYMKQKEHEVQAGHCMAGPRFNAGVRVRVSTRSNTPYRGHTGIVDKEPVKDPFRFWYMVRFEVNGVSTVGRFAEEQLTDI